MLKPFFPIPEQSNYFAYQVGAGTFEAGLRGEGSSNGLKIPSSNGQPVMLYDKFPVPISSGMRIQVEMRCRIDPNTTFADANKNGLTCQFLGYRITNQGRSLVWDSDPDNAGGDNWYKEIRDWHSFTVVQKIPDNLNITHIGMHPVWAAVNGFVELSYCRARTFYTDLFEKRITGPQQQAFSSNGGSQHILYLHTESVTINRGQSVRMTYNCDLETTLGATDNFTLQIAVSFRRYDGTYKNTNLGGPTVSLPTNEAGGTFEFDAEESFDQVEIKFLSLRYDNAVGGFYTFSNFLFNMKVLENLRTG